MTLSAKTAPGAGVERATARRIPRDSAAPTAATASAAEIRVRLQRSPE